METKSLFALLEAKQIMHPTSVRELRVSNNTITMELIGFPWWLPTESIKGNVQSTAQIEFTSASRASLTEGCLTSEPLHEDLEEFSVTALTFEVEPGKLRPDFLL